jgi:hypothetical protein
MDVIYLEFVYVILIVLKVRKASDLCLASLEFFLRIFFTIVLMLPLNLKLYSFL